MKMIITGVALTNEKLISIEDTPVAKELLLTSDDGTPQELWSIVCAHLENKYPEIAIISGALKFNLDGCVIGIKSSVHNCFDEESFLDGYTLLQFFPPHEEFNVLRKVCTELGIVGQIQANIIDDSYLIR